MVTTVELVKALVNAKHGWAVADQFEATFNDEPFEEQNYNALIYIRGTVRELLNSDLLSEYPHDKLQTYSDDLEDYIAREDKEEENDNGDEDNYDNIEEEIDEAVRQSHNRIFNSVNK
jgi:hypothetical protein